MTLYLVGGASRSGKSQLARYLLREQQIPYFSLDVLMMGLANGWPTFGMDPEASRSARSAQLWPIVRAMAINLLEEALAHPSYLFEGDTLSPQHAAELSAAYPGQVRACFLGYPALDPAAKLHAIRAVEPDWCSYYTEAQALAFLAGERAFSADLQCACARYGLPFFDSTDGLNAAVNAAARALTK